ncbi:hypothetical protein RDI58_010598 [Solanum bulbocastanum]|uniref:Paired amphipathic helix protein Sin3-like 2 n=1 Tax=Solanum bulbocastanum TaxID=147425 RepID=A0AAN8YGI3_SOLBU
MKIHEAFSYLNQFKDTFPNQSEKYIKFLGIMTDFKIKSMKRSRDDSPFGFSHRDSQSHVSGGGLDNISGDSNVDRASASKPKMTIDEAFSYLNQVKDKFPNQRENYITFLVVMMDFMRKRFNIGGVIEKVKDLFKGHPSLLLGLNPFLPKGYEIVLNDEDEKTYLMEQVLNFVKKTEEHLENYCELKDIFSMFKKERKNAKEVHNKVILLLKDHPDLLEEFKVLLGRLSYC